MKSEFKKFLVIFFIITAPFQTFAAGDTKKGFFSSLKDAPTQIFNTLKNNITISLPFSNTVEVQNPNQTLKEASPRLREINKKIQEQTGIDFAKLIGWFAKILAFFFGFIVRILQTVSEALTPK